MAVTLLDRPRVQLNLEAAFPMQRRSAFTLMEVLISMMILGIMITGIVSGFIQSQKAAEWSAYSLAAHWHAMQPIEQARAARWDPYALRPVDELVISPTNILAVTTNVLDVPVAGGNVVWATNRTTIRTISMTPPLKEIAVECTWSFLNRGVFTNTVLTFRGPGQAN